MSARYKRASTPAEQQRIREEADKLRAAIADETTAQLAEAYERGAVLDFYFAEKLRDLEGSGFDIANFFSDMIASFDATREMRRPAEYRAARERVASRRVETARASEVAEDARRASLIKDLAEVDELLRLRNYVAAEARLKEMLKEHPNEPRIYFALAQAASLAAEDTTDDEALAERLNRALANYRASIEHASPERDGALLSRAHTAMGRILAFFERDDEALREFDAAIKVGQVVGGAYQEALTAKANLLAKKKGTTPQR
jgi:predicted Zn-dependent protease